LINAFEIERGANAIAIFSLQFEHVPNAQIGTNAIAWLTEQQAHLLIEKLQALPPSIKTIIVMEHFPIARGPNDVMTPPKWPKGYTPSALKEWWPELLNSQWWAYSTLVSDRGAASDVLKGLSELANKNKDKSYFWLFGHRHLRSLSTVGELTMVEAPNVASTDRGFYLGTKSASKPSSISWCPVQ
jgi:hypothetical protein